MIPPRPGMNTSLLPAEEAAEYQRRIDVAAAGRTAQYAALSLPSPFPA